LRPRAADDVSWQPRTYHGGCQVRVDLAQGRQEGFSKVSEDEDRKETWQHAGSTAAARGATMKMPLGWLWQHDHGAQRLRKDGAHLLVSLNISAVPDAHGTIVGPPPAHAPW